MRSAAALASAFEEVAQVRYSRSGILEGSRRLNQDLEPTGRSASAWATLSTASNECSAPVAATRTSNSPGVIGASIFSPRPARGYRFHSLQVEIIAASSQLQKLQPSSSKRSSRKRRLHWNLSGLPQKIGFGNHPGINITVDAKGGHRVCIPSTAHCGEVLQFCVVVVPQIRT